MIVTRLRIPLEQEEFSALVKISVDELRSPVDQARHIIRKELERRGLLNAKAMIDQAHPTQAQENR